MQEFNQLSNISQPHDTKNHTAATFDLSHPI